MKKEVFNVHVGSTLMKEKMLRDFPECIDAAAAVHASSMCTFGIR